MLAAIRDYLEKWQLLLIPVFLCGWLLGGSYLLWWRITARGAMKRLDMSKCLLTMLLAGGGGTICGGAVCFMANAFASSYELDWRWTPVIAGAVVAAPVALLVMYAMFDFSFRDTVRIGVLPLGGVIGLAVILGLAAYIQADVRVKAEREHETTERHLENVNEAIKNYEFQAENRNQPPENLEVLVKGEHPILKENYLRSASIPDLPVGFFYLPSPSVSESEPTKILRACELNYPGSEKGRVVLLVNGQCYWAPDADFQELLNDPKNAFFAAKFRIATKKQGAGTR